MAKASVPSFVVGVSGSGDLGRRVRIRRNRSVWSPACRHSSPGRPLHASSTPTLHPLSPSSQTRGPRPSTPPYPRPDRWPSVTVRTVLAPSPFPLRWPPWWPPAPRGKSRQKWGSLWIMIIALVSHGIIAPRTVRVATVEIFQHGRAAMQHVASEHERDTMCHHRAFDLRRCGGGDGGQGRAGHQATLL